MCAQGRRRAAAADCAHCHVLALRRRPGRRRSTRHIAPPRPCHHVWHRAGHLARRANRPLRDGAAYPRTTHNAQRTTHDAAVMRHRPSLCPHAVSLYRTHAVAMPARQAVDTTPRTNAGTSRTHACQCTALTLVPVSRRGRRVRTLGCRLTCRRRHRRRRSAVPRPSRAQG